jgi:transposase
LRRLAPLFEPLFEGIVARNISEDRWHADETRWEVFAEVEGKVGHRWYLWVFRSVSTVVFRLDPSRSAKVPKEHFGEEATGILNVDRYSAYKAMLPDGRILLAFCWAHVRRDFLAVARSWPKQESWALGWVDRIGGLYQLNEARLLARDEPAAFAEAQETLVLAVAKMKEEQQAQQHACPPDVGEAANEVLEEGKLPLPLRGHRRQG